MRIGRVRSRWDHFYTECLHNYFVKSTIVFQAKGRCKIPKGLKEVLPLLEKTIWRHAKCGYKPLDNIACPSKVSYIHDFENKY